MKTHVRMSGLALLWLLAVNCGKDDPLPAAPDAAAKDGGAADAVKAEAEPPVDLGPSTDTTAPDAALQVVDAVSVDVAAKADGAVDQAPVVVDASLDSAVRLDGGSPGRDADLTDLVLVSPSDGGADAPVADAPVADAPVIDAAGEGAGDSGAEG